MAEWIAPLTPPVYRTRLLREPIASLFGRGFELRCFQLLSRIAWLFRDPVGSLIHYWLRLGVPFVLPESCPQMQTLPTDSNHTVSRRIEPSSRSLLIGEHPHPWLLMHSQVRKSRQRSSKPPGRSICKMLIL